jgi:hypothetical protein
LSSIVSGRRSLAFSACALSAALALVAVPTAFSAEKVGVAAAFHPDAFGSLDGGPRSQLKIGKSIFYNQRIDTTSNSSMAKRRLNWSIHVPAQAKVKLIDG